MQNLSAIKILDYFILKLSFIEKKKKNKINKLYNFIILTCFTFIFHISIGKNLIKF